MSIRNRMRLITTKPRTCSAMIIGEPSELDGHRLSTLCRKRVLKRGLCAEHEVEREASAEIKRLTITRHRIGHDDTGKMVYGTVGESVMVNWCNVISCRRSAVININGMLWCMNHFAREQKRLMK